MTTLVSMLFDLARHEGTCRRSTQDYLDKGKFILSLDVPLILFVEEPFASFCLEEREKHGLSSKTCIHKMPIQSIPYYSLLEQVEEARAQNPLRNGSPTKDTALYTVMCWSKLKFVETAIQTNPFGSTHFGWIDFGISYVADTRFVEEDRIFWEMPDPIRLLRLRPVYPSDHVRDAFEFYQYERGIIAAGYITGSIKSWRSFIELFDRHIRNALNIGLAPSEQQVFAVLADLQPALFTPFHGDYRGVLANYKHFRVTLDNILNYTIPHAPSLDKEFVHSLIQTLFNDKEFWNEEEKRFHKSLEEWCVSILSTSDQNR